MSTLRRPWPLALLVAVAAQALFGVRLGVPSVLVFDEVHYVPAARTLWTLAGPANPEHPLLGKLAIGAGIALFGDNPIGWRAAASAAGTATVVGVFAILWLLYVRPRPALIGAAIAAMNFTVFVEARTAMLDGIMAALVVWGLAALLWAMRGPAVVGRWMLGAGLLGLAVGTKWTALPYLGFAGLGFALARGDRRWPWLRLIAGWGLLGGVAGAAYLATFAPAFLYHHQPLTPSTLPAFQREMWALQTQVLPAHPYQSPWYTWPLDLRPVWYLYQPVDGAQRGILYLVNPAVAVGGLVAVAMCLCAGVRRRDARAGAVAGLWLGSWLMWAAIPKSLGFLYYYHLSSVWLALAIPAAFETARGRLHGWDEAYLVVVAALFIHFYPILAATPLAGPDAFRHWMWLKSWI